MREKRLRGKKVCNGCTEVCNGCTLSCEAAI
nr:MAG TPA: hypothetical protein [Caudoviricetes sp.]